MRPFGNDYQFSSFHNEGSSRMSSEFMAQRQHNRHIPKTIPPIQDYDLPDDHKSNTRIDYEKSEPIVRLLAQVRKVGMDILFPQSTHDKILACIFVAIKVYYNYNIL